MAWTAPRTWVAGEVETAAVFNAHVRDNLQAGPVASTVTALNALFNGTPGTGARGYIKVGSSPFDYVSLVYDAATSKWVEEDADLLAAVLSAQNTTGSTYSQVAVGPLMPHKAFTDAGLVLNVRLIGVFLAGTSSQIGVGCLASTGALGGAPTLDTTHQTGTLGTSATTPVIADSGWTALNASITPVAYVALSIGASRTVGANNGTINPGTALWQRWTS